MRSFTANLFVASVLSTSGLAAITCLKPGATAAARWTNSAGRTCTWTGVVGSNFGTNSVNGGDYSCNGRCGAGCTGTSVGNAWTQDCFSHDICSWFNNASGGASDPNCGSAYSAAVDDTTLGVLNGCGSTNPSNAASRPSTTPACFTAYVSENADNSVTYVTPRAVFALA